MPDKPRTKGRIIILLVISLWFTFGYIGAAEWAGSFYGQFGNSIETKGSCARSSLLYFVAGPFGAFVGFMMNNYKPMWDWPRHLFGDYKVGVSDAG